MSTPVGSASAPREEPIAPIGEVKGTLHWQRTQLLSVPVGSVPQGLLAIHAVYPTKTGPKPRVRFNEVTGAGNAVSVTYTVSDLPLGVPIQFRIIPTEEQDPGTFVRMGESADVSLSLEKSVQTGFDFMYEPLP